MSEQEQIKYILSKIRAVPDFPKKGIIFRDIGPLLADAKGFKMAVDILASRARALGVGCVCGIESRGFIFGAAAAAVAELPFIPMRKPGKLPGEVHNFRYALEYGFDELQVQKDAFSGITNKKAALIDDLIATGGTALAACELVKMAGGELVEAMFVTELTQLDGVAKLQNSGFKCFSLLKL